jgi:hypothetical protein
VVDEVAGRLVGTLNSSKLWDIAGGVTGPAASRLVFADAQALRAKPDQQQARKDARTAEDTARRQNAAPLLDAVKAIVRQKGWHTGGRGGLTSQMLKDVLFLLNQPAKGTDKVADLVAKVQVLLAWNAQTGFPGDPVQVQAQQPIPDLPPH